MVKPQQIKRSNRKTIAIKIEDNGDLIVRAPFYVSEEELNNIILSKEKWIRSKQYEALKRNAQIQPKQYIDGEKFLYLGEVYPLEIVPTQRSLLVFDGNRFTLRQSAVARGRETFIRWYRTQTRLIISGRVASITKKMHLKHSVIRITGAKTRWGSCGPKGSLNFSWRIIMAPIDVVDYVVVHEVAHLKIRGHSPDFWKIVQRYYPDYRKRKSWLREFGHRLTI